MLLFVRVWRLSGGSVCRNQLPDVVNVQLISELLLLLFAAVTPTTSSFAFSWIRFLPFFCDTEHKPAQRQTWMMMEKSSRWENAAHIWQESQCELIKGCRFWFVSAFPSFQGRELLVCSVPGVCYCVGSVRPARAWYAEQILQEPSVSSFYGSWITGSEATMRPLILAPDSNCVKVSNSSRDGDSGHSTHLSCFIFWFLRTM